MRCTCVWAVHVCVNMYMKSLRLTLKIFLNCSLPFSLRQDLQLNPDSPMQLVWPAILFWGLWVGCRAHLTSARVWESEL